MDFILTLLTNIDLRYSVTVLSQVCVVSFSPVKSAVTAHDATLGSLSNNDSEGYKNVT